jgi:hypothetical protein
MPLYRAKPVVVEAVQFTGSNVSEIAGVLGWEYEGENVPDVEHLTMVVEASSGDLTVNVGDWVVKTSYGEGQVYEDEAFRSTFDPIGLEF